MNKTELEIKCLLGTQERADNFIEALRNYGIDIKQHQTPEHQLNHYFAGGDVMKIYDHFSSQLPLASQEQLYDICIRGHKHSVRTRNILPGDHTILVIKSSTNTDSSTHSVTRLEFEYEFTDMNLEELDRVLLNLGWKYLSKWSRIRTNYKVDDITICLDCNAGYGYLAEFETVLGPGEDIHHAEDRIRSLMNKLGVHELSQVKLERMFAYYNKNRPEYYGTNRTFDMDEAGNITVIG